MFVAIGRAFKLKVYINYCVTIILVLSLQPRSANTPVQMTFDLDVTVDIQEEDTKGNFNSVSMERDIFKLRPQVRKKVLFTVSQSIHGNNKQLPFERYTIIVVIIIIIIIIINTLLLDVLVY